MGMDRISKEIKGEITVEALSFSYRQELASNSPDLAVKWALRDVGFVIQPGQRIAIVGKNGSGKYAYLSILHNIQFINSPYIPLQIDFGLFDGRNA